MHLTTFQRTLLIKKWWVITLLGFASGLPLALTMGTLTVWMYEEGVSLSDISIYSLIGLPYVIKFLWSPFLDKNIIPLLKDYLGKRRSWLIVAQIGLIFSVYKLGCSSPMHNPSDTVFWGVWVAFFSATQDISVDAYRIEILQPGDQALGVSLYTLGYRIGMIISGGGALALTHYCSWNEIYIAMSGILLIGICTTLWAEKEPVLKYQKVEKARIHALEKKPPFFYYVVKYGVYVLGVMVLIGANKLINGFYVLNKTGIMFYLYYYFGAFSIIILTENKWRKIFGPELSEENSEDPVLKWIYFTFIIPFQQMKEHPKWFILLLLIISYKLPDAFLGRMMFPFFKKMQFNNVDLALIVKTYGMFATIIGSFMGAYCVKKWGEWKALFLGGIVQIVSNLFFIVQYYKGASITFLTITMTIENLTGGLGSAIFVGFLGKLCNKEFTANQYALLSVLASCGRVLFATYSGQVVECYGWVNFFIISALTGIPALFLLMLLKRNIK